MSKIINLKDENIKDKAIVGLDVKGVAIVKFGAEWCWPCVSLDAKLELFAENQNDIQVYMLNVDEAPDASRDFRIMSIPATYFFKDWKLADIPFVLWDNLNDIEASIKLIK